MLFLFGLLTVTLVFLSLFLILLVLLQLPKKDAGTGMAFGGAAADALFGAGSGNVLTKITYGTGITFFVVVLALSFVHDHLNSSGDVDAFTKKLQQQQHAAALAQPPAAPATTQPAMAPATNSLKLLSAPATTAPTSTPATTPANKN